MDDGRLLALGVAGLAAHRLNVNEGLVGEWLSLDELRKAYPGDVDGLMVAIDRFARSAEGARGAWRTVPPETLKRARKSP